MCVFEVTSDSGTGTYTVNATSVEYAALKVADAARSAHQPAITPGPMFYTIHASTTLYVRPL